MRCLCAEDGDQQQNWLREGKIQQGAASRNRGKLYWISYGRKDGETEVRKDGRTDGRTEDKITNNLFNWFAFYLQSRSRYEGRRKREPWNQDGKSERDWNQILFKIDDTWKSIRRNPFYDKCEFLFSVFANLIFQYYITNLSCRKSVERALLITDHWSLLLFILLYLLLSLFICCFQSFLLFINHNFSSVFKFASHPSSLIIFANYQLSLIVFAIH